MLWDPRAGAQCPYATGVIMIEASKNTDGRRNKRLLWTCTRRIKCAIFLWPKHYPSLHIVNSERPLRMKLTSTLSYATVLATAVCGVSALHLTNFTIGEKTTIVWTPKGPDDNAALVFLLGNPQSGFDIYQGFPDGPWGRVSAALGSLEVTLDPKLKAGWARITDVLGFEMLILSPGETT
ncbi:hypothetical protein D9611_007186 [Ephemerocybe angulata]|uniref:Uncharacterized protein n=1 Tax=Ephemerocybe angulata TaxID=980116 RepID=A0A8H5B107_9AGAR|nr:hypothetical protein D9611_007186 [Tulosesus angulatus]